MNPEQKQVYGDLSLEELIREVEYVLDTPDGAAGKEEEILTLLRRYNHYTNDWQQYALFDSGKNYTRNLIFTNDKFCLLALAWNPFRESPIHDHPCDGCFVKALQGTVVETRYETEAAMNGEFVVSNVVEAAEGLVTHINDSMGFHKVGNPSATPAVTLHLYSPPFAQCRVWFDPTNMEQSSSVPITFYSVNGERIDYNQSAPCKLTSAR